MFTGIIQETGKIESATGRGESMRLKVGCRKAIEGAGHGDSIAVDGVCLTVVELGAGWFEADVGEETYRRTTLASHGRGAAVNLEPALKMGSKMGGHIVTGHIDAVSRIQSVARRTTQVEMVFELPAALRRLVAEKGSVAIDGISLTVGSVDRSSFSVYLIPHTVEHTTLKDKKAGDSVNLEADVLARYVCNALDRNDGGGRLDALLEDFGYKAR